MELAKEVVHAVSEFEKNLMQLLEKAQETEPAEDSKKFERACGSVAFELGENLSKPLVIQAEAGRGLLCGKTARSAPNGTIFYTQ
jgi:hypothetical protein